MLPQQSLLGVPGPYEETPLDDAQQIIIHVQLGLYVPRSYTSHIIQYHTHVHLHTLILLTCTANDLFVLHQGGLQLLQLPLDLLQLPIRGGERGVRGTLARGGDRERGVQQV